MYIHYSLFVFYRQAMTLRIFNFSLELKSSEIIKSIKNMTKDKNTNKQAVIMTEAVELALNGVFEGKGGPFGCVIVKDDKVVGKGSNSVLATNDPTAHAEMVAIKDACKNLNSFLLKGCEVYTSCEPCPMCLGAIYWAQLDKVYYAFSQSDATKAGFNDQFIYEELKIAPDKRKIPFIQLKPEFIKDPFQEWLKKEDRKWY